MTPTITRRNFLKTTALAGGALVIGCRVGGRGAGDAGDAFQPNAWVRIDGEGRVTVTVDDMEMGQGVLTALPMLVAEELAVAWEDVETDYGTEDPSSWPRGISTGGSSSIRTSWEPLRVAGAAAREMLVTAAADEWQVERAELRAEDGAVIHEPTGRRRTYGQLVEAASALEPPQDPPLRDPAEHTIIGTSLPRLDTPSKVDGSHVHGIDVRIPEMRYAMIARSPVFGGRVSRWDDGAAREVEGVLDVVEVSNGVAVLAENTWAAQQGRDALEIEWDEGENAGLDDEAIWSSYAELARTGSPAIAHEDGDADAAVDGAPSGRRLEAVYRAPFLAHSPMEPQNCTAHVRGDEAEVWAPTQRLTAAQEIAAEAAGLPVENVTMHAIRPGGGFGRRLENDYVREAVEVSQQAGGVPVKVVWTREDDTRHSVYRPAALHRLRGAVGVDGSPSAWSQRVVAPSVIGWSSPGAVEDGMDGDAVAGSEELPYAVPNLKVDYVMAPRQIPLGWWRAVGHTHNAFVYESFIDEMARTAGEDPYAYRRRLLEDSPRHVGVLDAVAEAADWGGGAPAGRGRGIAVVYAFASYVAQVVEASVDADGGIHVHDVWCAVDCGRVINPGIVQAQLQSGVVFGLTAALYGKITIRDGGAVEGNFDTYRMLRMNEMPEVHVTLVESEEDPTGVGEPGVPPVAPALGNAIFDATGRRLRTLPLTMDEQTPVA